MKWITDSFGAVVFAMPPLSEPQLLQPPQAPADGSFAARWSTDQCANTRLRIKPLATTRRHVAGINVQLL